MSRVFIEVLGPVRATIDGEPVHLGPRTKQVLMRLVMAANTAVPADDIYRDIWGEMPCGQGKQRSARLQVQKHVSRLRSELGGDLIVTQRPAYRIVLNAGNCDWLKFQGLLEAGDRAAGADPAAAARVYDRAAGLLPDEPLSGARGTEFGREWAVRAACLREAALRGAACAYRELGDLDSALQRAELLPGGDFLESLREEKRVADSRGDVVRRAFPELGTVVTVRTGDLFDQYDANLAIGFGDMFDTDTHQGAVISRHSVQGQLLDWLYGGDVERLDRDLDEALKTGGHAAVEENDSKPLGKRRRYAIGTAVPLPLPPGDGRQLLAFAHCRQGKDFVTRSTPEDLDTALAALWAIAQENDAYRPLAMPVVGSGAARVQGLNRVELTVKIIASFLEACRTAGVPCAKELRIMVRPGSLTLARRDVIRRYVHGLGFDSREPVSPGAGCPASHNPAPGGAPSSRKLQ